MMNKPMNMFKIKHTLSSIAKTCLASNIAFAPMVAASIGASQFAMTTPANAASAVIKIKRSGPGVSKTIKLGLNKAVVIDLPADAYDILVADPEMADAITRTSRRIYLFGKSVGQTNIFVFGKNGKEIVSLDIEIERDVAGLVAHLKRFIPNSDISVEIISDNIVLTGYVRTPQDAARAAQLAEIFVTGGEATTRSEAVTAEGGDAAIFNEDRQKSSIVNLLQIDGEDQVTLKVTIAEVSRQIVKQLGLNTSVGAPPNTALGEFDPQNPYLFRNNNPANLGKPLAFGNFARIGGSIGGYDIASYVNAMERAGVMRTLAEPSLTAISGEAAQFFVGGEFNQTTGRDIVDGVVTYENTKVEYGIRLNFTPVVLGPGRISLKVRTEVSEPTFEDNAVIGGTGDLPGTTFTSIRKREAETAVELPSGGSIVIAGLIKDDIRQAMSGLPGLSKIPILGTLFRSRDFIRNENELVIIATPYLVKPVTRNALSRPDDNFNPASDGSGFFLGRINKVYGQMETDLPKGRYHGAVGFIYK